MATAKITKKESLTPKKKIVKKTKSIKASPKTIVKETALPNSIPFDLNIKSLTSKINSQSISRTFSSLSQNQKISKKAIIALIIIAVLVLGYMNKKLFIAATVNGLPITNFELLAKMNKSYRDQTLNEMITEKVILDAGLKQGVVIPETAVDAKISQYEKTAGGKEALAGLLAQQKQTLEGLRQIARLNLTIEKLYDKDATVSAEEVQKFIDQNKDQMQSSDSAQQVTEATQALKDQKIFAMFNQKFPELKQQANIKIF